MGNWRWFLVIGLVLGGLSVGCDDSGTDDAVDGEGLTVVMPGKADNFYSESAQEYVVEGDYFVYVEEGLEAEAEVRRVHELIYFQQIAINWFLLKYLMGVEDDHDIKYKSLTKNGSYEDLDIRQDEDDPLKYHFTFRQEVGGQMRLIKELPTVQGDDGVHRFPLPIGVVPNYDLGQLEINNEWYRSDPWGSFDPAKLDESKVDYIDMSIRTQPRSFDAYIDYKQLYADGEVTMGIHFGWDYHSEYHLKHSEDVFDYLVNQGFESPVDSWSDYTRTSGPLVKTIQAADREVTFKIWLYWGAAGTDTDPDTAAGGRTLEDDMRYSFSDREVIVFSGHSGPFYGFALANWRKTDEGDLDDSEIATLKMPTSYQVVLAEGCETYALGEAFFSNPAKSSQENLDVITTTNFSNASTAGVVRNFINAMMGDDNGDHEPWTYGDLLSKLDRNSYWFHSMYGVHGIDNNPRLHPYAVEENFCQECDRDSDCGPVGNKCVSLSDARVCTALCITSDACPEGYSCVDVAQGSWITTKACVPTNYTCEEPAPETNHGVIINELLVSPPSGEAGDANKDGIRSYRDDEFVELVNAGTTTADLSDYSIADSYTSRFTFPLNTTLEPGEALVVFGGGSASAFDFGAVQTFVSGGLGLNNSGDHVMLLDRDGEIVDEVEYGEGVGNQGVSLVRGVDGDPESDFVQHGGALAFTPGTQTDGSAF